ncbi:MULTISPECIES: hypothetical protein [Brevundimonas]|uniref:hypothetical protein n=1 Tax=Brevundimonas sp. Bb-A TaxID=2560058 RepID=UPI00128EBC11|nr:MULTISPECIES: hypothetical protein [Brevundimonas]QFU30117.1 hypothetical protein BSP_00430 [Brevundimonas sp. Bb-A]
MSLPVVPFETNLHIEMRINLDDAADDRRRITAEWWCCDHADGRWFRSVDKLARTVRFSFESDHDAIAFWLAN